MLAQVSGREKAAPAIGNVLQPAAPHTSLGKNWLHLAFMSEHSRQGVPWASTYNVSLTALRKAFIPCRAFLHHRHLLEQCFHAAGHATSGGLGILQNLLWCATGRAVEFTHPTGDPIHTTDEAHCMEVMLQQGLLSWSPLRSHWELSRDHWIKHFPEVLPWPDRVEGIKLLEDRCKRSVWQK